MKYIDADKLIAEIERRREKCADIAADERNEEVAEYYRGKEAAYDETSSLITSLQQEQPEVDLDDVIENYILENFGERWDGCVPIGCFELDLMAEHFYRLGFKNGLEFREMKNRFMKYVPRRKTD